MSSQVYLHTNQANFFKLNSGTVVKVENFKADRLFGH